MIEEYPYTIGKFAGIQVIPLILHIDDSGHFFGHPRPQPLTPNTCSWGRLQQETD
jgi:hypothetical protein